MSEAKASPSTTADKLSTKSIPDKLGEADRLSKAKDVGKILSRAILHVHSLMKPAAKIRKVCEAGDNFLRLELAKVYGKSSRGLALPTCISPNNIVSNFIPANDGRDTSVAAMVMDFAGGPRRPVLLRQGDLVKVQMGVHIDGQTILSTIPFVVHRSGAIENAREVLATIKYGVPIVKSISSVKGEVKVKESVEHTPTYRSEFKPLTRAEYSQFYPSAPLSEEEPVQSEADEIKVVKDAEIVKVDQAESDKADKLLIERKKKFVRDQIKDKRANLILGLQAAAKCVANCITPTTTLDKMKQLIDFVATEHGCFALVDTKSPGKSTDKKAKSSKDVNGSGDASQWAQLSRLGKYRLYGEPFAPLKKASKPLPDPIDEKSKGKGKKRSNKDKVSKLGKVEDKAKADDKVEVEVEAVGKEEVWLVTITMSTANDAATPARDMKPILYVRDKDTPFVSLKNKMSRPMLADISKLLGADTEAKNGYPFRVDQLLELSSQNSAALKNGGKLTSGKFIKPLKAIKVEVKPTTSESASNDAQVSQEKKEKVSSGKVSVRLGLKEITDRKLIQPIHAAEVEEGEYAGQLSFSLFKRANGEFFCLTDPIGIVDPLLQSTIATTTIESGANVVGVGIDAILNAGSKVRAFKY